MIEEEEEREDAIEQIQVLGVNEQIQVLGVNEQILLVIEQIQLLLVIEQIQVLGGQRTNTGTTGH